MFKQVLVVAVVVAAASSGDIGFGFGGIEGLEGVWGHGGGIIAPLAVAKHVGVVDYYSPAHYDFKYGVGNPKTGDHKEQAEVLVDDVVKGQYSLAEPDDTIRVVKYTADDHNGFNAVVSRVGHAVHPQPILVHKEVAVGSIGLGRVGLGGHLW